MICILISIYTLHIPLCSRHFNCFSTFSLYLVYSNFKDKVNGIRKVSPFLEFWEKLSAKLLPFISLVAFLYRSNTVNKNWSGLRPLNRLFSIAVPCLIHSWFQSSTLGGYPEPELHNLLHSDIIDGLILWIKNPLLLFNLLLVNYIIIMDF